MKIEFTEEQLKLIEKSKIKHDKNLKNADQDLLCANLRKEFASLRIKYYELGMKDVNCFAVLVTLFQTELVQRAGSLKLAKKISKDLADNLEETCKDLGIPVKNED